MGSGSVTERLVYVLDRDDEKERLAFMLLDDGTYRFLLEYQEPDIQHGYLWAARDFPGRYGSLKEAKGIASMSISWFRPQP
jgi:hypothetical protein